MRAFFGLLALLLPLPALWAQSGGAEIRVNGARLWQNLQALAQIGRTPSGGISRVAYTDADRAGRAFVMDLMRRAGMSVRVDAAGNIVGRYPGRDPARRPIALGSHIDSVPEGGAFDGTVGVMAAIEVVHTLSERGIQLEHPLEVWVFSNEEGGLSEAGL